MDFTLTIYKELLGSLKQCGYLFYTVEEYCSIHPSSTYILLRHDVDLRATHSLITAQLEAEMGIKASYYFRVKELKYQANIIRQIADLGHEIGYHYTDLVDAKGNYEKAIVLFEQHLKLFRKIAPICSIAMHGSPTSKYDNRDLWKRYNYKKYGIIAEPYFDIDFDQVHYLTDTGRMWDGERYNLRDKIVDSEKCKVESEKTTIDSYHSTKDMIHAIKSGRFPERVMITTHPQRWTDNKLEWLMELLMQRIKNVIKRMIIHNAGLF